MSTSIKKLIFGCVVGLAAISLSAPAQAGHGGGFHHGGGFYRAGGFGNGRGWGVSCYRPYRLGYYGCYGYSPLYVGTSYQQPYPSGPVSGQVYLVPAAFASAALGTVIQFGGYSYVIGSNGTMTAL
jgi:hypothetical protein